MNALLHYQSALLLRSQRWLAPVILYAVFLAVGVQSGQPVLDSLAYAAAALLPVAAWIVRICVTNEPPAARSCTAAAAGPWRAHLATLLSAFLASAVLGVVATVVVAVISDAASTDHRTAVNRIAASGAGLLAMLVSALLGTAIGAVTNWPLLRSCGVGDLRAAACRAARARHHGLTGAGGPDGPDHGVAGRGGAGAVAAGRRGRGAGGRGGGDGLRARFAEGMRSGAEGRV